MNTTRRPAQFAVRLEYNNRIPRDGGHTYTMTAAVEGDKANVHVSQVAERLSTQPNLDAAFVLDSPAWVKDLVDLSQASEFVAEGAFSVAGSPTVKVHLDPPAPPSGHKRSAIPKNQPEWQEISEAFLLLAARKPQLTMRFVSVDKTGVTELAVVHDLQSRATDVNVSRNGEKVDTKALPLSIYKDLRMSITQQTPFFYYPMDASGKETGFYVDSGDGTLYRWPPGTSIAVTSARDKTLAALQHLTSFADLDAMFETP